IRNSVSGWRGVGTTDRGICQLLRGEVGRLPCSESAGHIYRQDRKPARGGARAVRNYHRISAGVGRLYIGHRQRWSRRIRDECVRIKVQLVIKRRTAARKGCERRTLAGRHTLILSIRNNRRRSGGIRGPK